MVKNYFLLLILAYCMPPTIIGFFATFVTSESIAVLISWPLFAGLFFMVFLNIFLFTMHRGSVNRAFRDYFSVVVLGVVTFPAILLILFAAGVFATLLVLLVATPIEIFFQKIHFEEQPVVISVISFTLTIMILTGFAFALSRFFAWFNMIILRSKFTFSKKSDREFSFIITLGTMGGFIIHTFGLYLILAIPNCPTYVDIFLTYFSSAIFFSALLWCAEKRIGRENFWPAMKIYEYSKIKI